MNITKTLTVAAALAAGACMMHAEQPKVVAHRGYWDTPGSAQNSIRSLVKADSIGCYASEFDVWRTKDGVIVVNHDPTINGVDIESSTADKVLCQKLANGETIPTLEQYLAAAQPLSTRLVLELKSHNSNSNEKAAITQILALVKKYGLEDRTEYITFSKNGFCCLIGAAPKGCGVQYLSGDYIPAQIKQHSGKGIDYKITVLRKHPEWIKECHDLGLTVNVWTVNKPEDMQWCIDNGVDYITTNDPEGLQKLLKK